jgi:alpha-L-fucosidase
MLSQLKKLKQNSENAQTNLSNSSYVPEKSFMCMKKEEPIKKELEIPVNNVFKEEQTKLKEELTKVFDKLASYETKLNGIDDVMLNIKEKYEYILNSEKPKTSTVLKEEFKSSASNNNNDTCSNSIINHLKEGKKKKRTFVKISSPETI